VKKGASARIKKEGYVDIPNTVMVTGVLGKTRGFCSSTATCEGKKGGLVAQRVGGGGDKTMHNF